MPNPLLLSCWVILLPGLDVIGIWEERYWVYGWFHHVPSQHRLWIARITLCSAAWFFETGPDLRIFHAGETHNKTIQNPWLLLVRFSTTVCCDVISKQVPRKQHTHTHTHTHTPWKSSTSQPWKKRAGTSSLSFTRLFCGQSIRRL